MKKPKPLLTKKIQQELDWKEVQRYYPNDYEMWEALKNNAWISEDPPYHIPKVDKDTENWLYGRGEFKV